MKEQLTIATEARPKRYALTQETADKLKAMLAWWEGEMSRQLDKLRAEGVTLPAFMSWEQADELIRRHHQQETGEKLNQELRRFYDEAANG